MAFLPTTIRTKHAIRNQVTLNGHCRILGNSAHSSMIDELARFVILITSGHVIAHIVDDVIAAIQGSSVCHLDIYNIGIACKCHRPRCNVHFQIIRTADIAIVMDIPIKA